jgi:hypothetical protein
MAIYHPTPSKKTQLTTPESKVLTGWKDIGDYLGKSVRTVQRYERHLRLPVHRPSGRSGGSVTCSSFELEKWVSESPMMQSDQRRAIQSGVDRIVQGLSGPNFRISMERHKAIAAEQKARATDMIEHVGDMIKSAIDMRRPPHQLLIINC